MLSHPRVINKQSSWVNIRNAYNTAVGLEESTIQLPISEKNGFHVLIYVGQTPNAGRGVFATHPITKGTLVYTNLRQRAVFKTGSPYRRFLSTLSNDWVCDLLSWCHVAYEDLDEKTSARIICVLDEGSLVNSANGGDDLNLGRLEDAKYLCQGDCRMNFFATRDIDGGEELLASYGEYIESPAWDLSYKLFEW